MSSIFEKFSTHSKNAIKQAFSFALAAGHKEITPQHLLYGLSLQKGSIASQILTKSKLDKTYIKEQLTTLNQANKTITNIDLAPTTKRILEKSFLLASLNRHKYIGTEHLLASLLDTNDPTITDFFKQQRINSDDIKQQIRVIFNSTSKFPDLGDAINYFRDESKPENYFQPPTQVATPSLTLEVFATNLTDPKIQKNIDPVIGRQEEISRVIQILSRRNKNNPLLLGDPGVGKTAIVEGLAKKILDNDVPEVLIGKKIYALDLSLVVAGTSFRGEFENRLKQIIGEVKANPDIILFIDEIHNIIGVGSATGSMDAANILKPALARGEIKCIGATTLDDYKKQLETDPALERRFQPVTVNQPDVEKTIEILKGVKINYEIFHQVAISNEAIIAAATLSDRYINDRFLPDKAIDLIDEAASETKIKTVANPLTKKIWEIERNLRQTAEKKQQAVKEEKFNLALKFRDQEQELITELKTLREKQLHSKRKLPEIGPENIARIVSKITGIPLSDLVVKEKANLLKIEKSLSKKIVDQDEAVSAIAQFIRRSRTGIANANRPIGSFIFLGPSGVGKTELAKSLAQVVFGSAQSLIKIDMSEFAESFNISKLIGAPAGYVGYKETTKLTDAVRRRPYSVVLFDEIEKAHPQVFNLMLQILEDGYLTDGAGKKINFRNTIIIMTSNLGSDEFNRQGALGFQETTPAAKQQIEKNFSEIQQGVFKKLKNKFPPEFLSRIDKTIVFQPLSEKAMTKIAKLHLEELKDRLNKQSLTLIINPKVATYIAKHSYSPEIGARAIRKNIQDLIENPIATKILTQKDVTKKISITVKDNKIII
ncbi:MAG: ATP-dependent Clp protease ATP-binding subunit [Candidatus Buchananbacteria bacterium]|nr:ATP-dependent Clp protease ATP-binding subunit [Candidatus Buchananbacteria bacterium]